MSPPVCGYCMHGSRLKWLCCINCRVTFSSGILSSEDRLTPSSRWALPWIVKRGPCRVSDDLGQNGLMAPSYNHNPVEEIE